MEELCRHIQVTSICRSRTDVNLQKTRLSPDDSVRSRWTWRLCDKLEVCRVGGLVLLVYSSEPRTASALAKSVMDPSLSTRSCLRTISFIATWRFSSREIK